MWEALSDADNAIPTSWEAEIAGSLRDIREDLGWSQAFAVERLREVWDIDMHQTTLAKLEAGKRPLRLAEFYALATLYGHSPGTVFARQAQKASSIALPGAAELDQWYFDQVESWQRALDASMEYLRGTVYELAGRQSAQAAVIKLLSAGARLRAAEVEKAGIAEAGPAAAAHLRSRLESPGGDASHGEAADSAQ